MSERDELFRSATLLTFDGEVSKRQTLRAKFAGLISAVEGESGEVSVLFAKSAEDQDVNGIKLLLASVLSGRFQSILVVQLASEQTRDLAELLIYDMHRLRQDMLRIELTGRLATLKPSLSEALAIAEFACLAEGAGVIEAKVPPPTELSELEFFSFAGSGVGVDSQSWRDFPLLLRVADSISSDLLGAATVRRKAGVHFGQDRPRREPPTPLDPFGPWRLRPDAETRRWILAEFSGLDVRREFENLTCRVYDEGADPRGDGPTTPSFNRVHRILLAAIRICRLLSTRTLEGTSFSLTVFIPADPESDLVKSYGKSLLELRSASGIEPEVFFNFDDLDRLNADLELAQGADVFVLIDRRTGRVLSLSTGLWGPRDVRENNGLRHKDMALRFGGTGVWIDVRAGRRVSVYVRRRGRSTSEDSYEIEKPRVTLEFNGYEWRRRPLDRLRKNLQDAFDTTKVNPEVCVSILGPAIVSLVENNESSIVVVVRQEDLKPFRARQLVERRLHETSDVRQRTVLDIGDISFVPMRPGVFSSESDPVKIQDLSWETVAGLLKADGAHFIADDGEILCFAQRVSAAKRDKKSQTAEKELDKLTPDRSKHIRNDPGSGSTTAQEIQDCLTKSRVIKASASGRYKYYRPPHAVQDEEARRFRVWSLSRSLLWYDSAKNPSMLGKPGSGETVDSEA